MKWFRAGTNDYIGDSDYRLAKVATGRWGFFFKNEKVGGFRYLKDAKAAAEQHWIDAFNKATAHCTTTIVFNKFPGKEEKHG